MQPGKQIVRRQIDQLELIGLIEDMVRQRFTLLDTGNLCNEIIQTLKVLNIDGRPDVDASFQQLLDILPALGVA